MLHRYLLTTILCVFTGLLYGQFFTNHNLHSPYVLGEYYKHELGAAGSIMRSKTDKEWNYGVHAHYVYFVKEGRLGVGLGYERIFNDDTDQTVGLVGAYRPIYPITVMVLGGVTFDNDAKTNSRFASQVEIIYEWAFRNLHFGPTVSYGYYTDDSRYGLGIHIGIGF